MIALSKMSDFLLIYLMIIGSGALYFIVKFLIKGKEPREI